MHARTHTRTHAHTHKHTHTHTLTANKTANSKASEEGTWHTMWSFLIVVYDITVYRKSWWHTIYGCIYDYNAYSYKSCIVSANLSPSHCLRALWEMDRLLSKMDANAQEAMRAHDISDIEVFRSLNTEDLREMGLSVGARKKIELLQK